MKTTWNGAIFPAWWPWPKDADHAIDAALHCLALVRVERQYLATNGLGSWPGDTGSECGPSMPRLSISDTQLFATCIVKWLWYILVQYNWPAFCLYFPKVL